MMSPPQIKDRNFDIFEICKYFHIEYSMRHVHLFEVYTVLYSFLFFFFVC